MAGREPRLLDRKQTVQLCSFLDTTARSHGVQTEDASIANALEQNVRRLNWAISARQSTRHGKICNQLSRDQASIGSRQCAARELSTEVDRPDGVGVVLRSRAIPPFNYPM